MTYQFQLMLQQAIQSFQDGKFERAELILKNILRTDAKNLVALHVLGLIKGSQGKCNEAIEFLGRAAKISPDDASIQYNLAKALMDCGLDKESIPHHKKSVELAPKNPNAWFNFGKSAAKMGRFDDALAYYNQTLNLATDYFEAWAHKGAIFNELKQYDEAIAHYDKALSLRPDYCIAWANKGAILSELKFFDEAIAHYDKALSLRPDFFEAWVYKGSILSELKRHDEAIAHYNKALAMKPDIDWLGGELLHTKMKTCDWLDYIEQVRNIMNRVAEGRKIVSPFQLLSLLDDPSLHKKASEIYVQHKYPFNPALGPILTRPVTQKIRVGYFSADFHNHATGYLMAEMFELHDKNNFELIGFSFGPKTNDDMSFRIESAFDQFFHVGDKTDSAIAQLSRNLNIDIAVDLKGFTQDSRAGIFSLRAAPIQVNYLGYPGTTGAEYIDYIVADKILITPDTESDYSEKIIYLPGTYQVNDRKRLISDRQFTRQQLGLPENGFVFCCFNNSYKILPTTFNSWMRVLNAVDGSVLWLLQDSPGAIENLKTAAEGQGVDPQRLIFANRTSLPDHLARHRLADLFLDTLPYNAHTTTSDALWSGLPVITLMGRSFASRVAASLLNAIDLPELVTNSQESYEALAIELAKNPKKLADIKFKLSNNRLTTPLFNTPIFTKNLEAAFVKIHEKYVAGLNSDHIKIDSV